MNDTRCLHQEVCTARPCNEQKKSLVIFLFLKGSLHFSSEALYFTCKPLPCLLVLPSHLPVSVPFPVDGFCLFPLGPPAHGAGASSWTTPPGWVPSSANQQDAESESVVPFGGLPVRAAFQTDSMIFIWGQNLKLHFVDCIGPI